MLTKEQLNILSVFKKDIPTCLTFKQIKEKSKQKSNNMLQIALEEFQREGIVKTTKVGNITTFQLNLDNNLTLSYLNLINETEINTKKFPKEILKDVQKKVSKYTEYFILIVFGSYAKENATKKSDLDIALIVESEQTKKEFTPFLETIKRREIIPIDYHIFTRNEFLEMLKTDYENLGKQIYKNNLVYYGLISYYSLVRKNE